MFRLQENNNVVFIACSIRFKEIYQQYGVKATFILHEDYPFKFRGNGNFMLDGLFSFYKLNRFKNKEQEIVEGLVNKHKIDLVLSDHRYGFYSKTVESVFITHQLNLPVGRLGYIIQTAHVGLIRKFNGGVWIVR